MGQAAGAGTGQPANHCQGMLRTKYRFGPLSSQRAVCFLSMLFLCLASKPSCWSSNLASQRIIAKCGSEALMSQQAVCFFSMLLLFFFFAAQQSQLVGLATCKKEQFPIGQPAHNQTLLNPEGSRVSLVCLPLFSSSSFVTPPTSFPSSAPTISQGLCVLFCILWSLYSVSVYRGRQTRHQCFRSACTTWL